MRKPTLGRTYPSRPPSPAAARGASRGRRAGLRLAGVRDARLDGLPHYDSSRFRRHRDARVAGHAVQAGR